MASDMVLWFCQKAEIGVEGGSSRAWQGKRQLKHIKLPKANKP